MENQPSLACRRWYVPCSSFSLYCLGEGYAPFQAFFTSEGRCPSVSGPVVVLETFVTSRLHIRIHFITFSGLHVAVEFWHIILWYRF